MRFRSLTILAFAVAVLGGGSHASASGNLVTNGSFETGDFTGWTQFGNTDGTGVGQSFEIDPVDGSYQAFFGPGGSIGGISQNLATVAGQTYDISFYLANLGGTPSEYKVQFGTNVLVDVVNAPSFGYTEYNFTATATSSETGLAFGFRQDPTFFLLDDIVVTEAVPEPASIISCGIAMLMGLGYVRGRRLRAIV